MYCSSVTFIASHAQECRQTGIMSCHSWVLSMKIFNSPKSYSKQPTQQRKFKQIDKETEI